MRHPGQITIFRAPEEGGGQSPAAAAPPGGQPSGGEGASVPGPYRPEGLPDHLAGASDRETIERLFGAYGPARDEIARFGELGKLPKDAAGYAYEPSDKVRPYLGDLAADPVWKAVREAAHKAGLRDRQFAPFVSSILDAMIDGDMVQPPVDLAAEAAKLVPADAAGLDEAGRKAAVDRRVRDNHATIEMWKARGLPPASAESLALMLDTAAGNQAIEFFAKSAQIPQPALPGHGGAGGVTKADLDARLRDPRGKVGDAKYDPAFVAETNRLFKALYPG